MQPRRRSLVAITAMLVATLLMTSSANADVVQGYLGWGSTTGSCSGSTYKAHGDQQFNPALHSVAYDLGIVTAGAVKTQKYNQDGVKVATKWFGCHQGSVKTYYAPKVYNHRWFTDIWYCAGASCTPIPRVYGSWESGKGPTG